MHEENINRVFSYAMEQISAGTDWGLKLDEAITQAELSKVLDLLRTGIREKFSDQDKMVLDMVAERLLGEPVFRRKVKSPPTESALDKNRVRKVVREVMTSHLTGKSH
ncbi:MAG: hypothetical protein H6581_19115 [Bacteroidia bacterium]|nr:hypothetical protein [Bacteroidia bacterium]